MKEKSFSRVISSLPTLTPVLKKICSVVEDPDSSSVELVKALQLDPVIAGKVLRLANSAYVGIPNTISSVQNAVSLLGANKIHSLVIASILRSSNNVMQIPFPVIFFWRHSICTAFIAEAIAKSLRRYDYAVDESEIFTSALLHDIGKLICAAAEPDAYMNSYKDSIEREKPFFMNEQDELSHCHLGGMYAEHWGFPSDLKHCIEFHHKPLSFDTCKIEMSIIHVADIMAHVMGFKIFPGEITPMVDPEVLNCIGLPLERLKVVAEKAVEDLKSAELLMDIIEKIT